MTFYTQNTSMHTRRAPSKGFTLVEVMIGAAIFTLTMIGMLSTTMLAYKYSLMARYKERAANALLTIADQFQNSPVTDHTTNSLKKLFQITSGPTGTGMAWDTNKQVFVYPNTPNPSGPAFAEGLDTSAGLSVQLSTVTDTTTPVVAQVTREVTSFSDPYPSVSTPSSPQVYMLEAVFTAKYTFLGDQTVAIKAIRTVTPSDIAQ